MTKTFQRVTALTLVVAATALAGRAAAGTSAPALRVSDVHTVTSEKRALVTASASGVYASTPVTLHAKDGDVLAYPPASPSATTSVVYLHGRNGLAERGCPYFRSGASELGWLVCPEAIERDAAGTYSWGADVFAQAPVVTQALRAAQSRGASTEPGVAVGFSQGSYVAVDLVKARLAKFRGLVLLGAEMHPNAQTLKDNGVRRVVLGAGRYDATYGSLVEEAKRLDGEGLETRFVDLGAIGHAYTVSDTTVLRDAITWAAGGTGRDAVRDAS